MSQRIAGKTVERILPDNLCYMMVNLEPQEEISVLFDYELDALGRIVQNQVDVDVRSADMVKDDFAWINGKFSEFLDVVRDPYGDNTLRFGAGIEDRKSVV